MSSKKERNHYGLKEMKNIKDTKIVSILSILLIEMFTNTENQPFYTKKSNF